MVLYSLIKCENEQCNQCHDYASYGYFVCNLNGSSTHGKWFNFYFRCKMCNTKYDSNRDLVSPRLVFKMLKKCREGKEKNWEATAYLTTYPIEALKERFLN